MKTLDDIWDSIPEVTCKGLCQSVCGPIAYSAIEGDEISSSGYNLPAVRSHPEYGALTCSHLTDQGCCAIHEVRPLVCRLFGAVRALKCPHGCKPEGGYLSDQDARMLLHTAQRLSGGRTSLLSIQENT